MSLNLEFGLKNLPAGWMVKVSSVSASEARANLSGVWNIEYGQAGPIPTWFATVHQEFQCEHCGQRSSKSPFFKGYGFDPLEALEMAMRQVAPCPELSPQSRNYRETPA